MQVLKEAAPSSINVFCPSTTSKIRLWGEISHQFQNAAIFLQTCCQKKENIYIPKMDLFSCILSCWAKRYAEVILFVADTRFAHGWKWIGVYEADEELLDEALCDTAQTYSSKDKSHTTKVLKKGENPSHFSGFDKLMLQLSSAQIRRVPCVIKKIAI